MGHARLSVGCQLRRQLSCTNANHRLEDFEKSDTLSRLKTFSQTVKLYKDWDLAGSLFARLQLDSFLDYFPSAHYLHEPRLKTSDCIKHV